MRLLIFVVSVSALAASAADARSLQIHGVTGYLSEYDLSASVSGEASKGIEELSGPLNIKHVGLCTHDGPNEMLSYLKLEFVNASAPVHCDVEFRWPRVQLSWLLVGILHWRSDVHRGAEPAAQAVGEIGLSAGKKVNSMRCGTLAVGTRTPRLKRIRGHAAVAIQPPNAINTTETNHRSPRPKSAARAMAGLLARGSTADADLPVSQ